ncbi:MAG: hypothetical protein ABSG97_01940 [Sedimentisphaerales bacterium]|jgi:hypothetical protein
MNFKISYIQNYISPSNLDTNAILKIYGTSVDSLESALKNTLFIYQNITKGFQKELAKQIEDVLKKHFQGVGGQLCFGRLYSPVLGEKPDVAIGLKGRSKKIFIEIEFRPNEHKDIVKFLIGHKKQTLELAILIVPVDRKTITKYYPKRYKTKYHTMTEFGKCVKIIEELQSDCPIWVMGFDGKWVSA